MNKKTFTLALIFLVTTLIWFGLNLYGAVSHTKCVCKFDLLIGFLFVVAAAGIVHHEFNKKRRKHLADVDKRRIP